MVASADVLHVSGTRHFMGILAETIARRRGVPYVVMPEGSVPPRSRSIPAKGVADALYTRRSLGRAFKVIATSQSESEDLVGWGLARELLAVMPPRADRVLPSPISREELRTKWELPPDVPVILWIGRIHPEKGLPVLLQALADSRLATVHALLGGEGDDGLLRALKRQANDRNLGSRVKFLGWIERAEKAELFKLADLFVLPSRKENFGLAAAEAVASGLPALVTDQCGVASIIDRIAGIACPHGPDAIAEALARLLDDAALLAKFREGTKSAADRLVWPPVVEFLGHVYSQAVKSRDEQKAILGPPSHS